MRRLIRGDCYKVLKILESNTIDLTVTSPPYDALRSYNGLSFESFHAVARELYRVTKNGGVVVWVVGDATIDGSETGTSFKQALFFKSVGFNLHDTMIYLKQGTSFTHKNRYYPAFEYMFVFSKGKPKTFNAISDRKNKQFGKPQSGTQREKDGSLRAKLNAKNVIKEYGVRFNVWEIGSGFMKSTTDKIAFKHPAIFPEALARDHIFSWSNPGDTILDPFMGSGTTGKMSKLLGRKFIGIEKEKEYFEICKQRLGVKRKKVDL